MSLIFSSFVSVINKISDEFHKSLLFTVIFSVLTFIENQWVNSFFKKLYPSENFLSFLNRSEIFKSKIFHPLIVLLVFSGFLILSLNHVSHSLSISLAIAFIFFFIGCVLLPKFFLNENKVILISFNPKDIYSIGFILMLISFVFFGLSIVSVGGIPLLKPSIR